MTVEKWLEKAEKHGEYHADLKRACQIIRRQQEALKKYRAEEVDALVCDWSMLSGTSMTEAALNNLVDRMSVEATQALSDCDAIVEGK